MKAVYLKNIDDVILKEVAMREVDCNESRIKIEACGICGTDVTSAINGSKDYFAFGHEIAGTIIESGKGVKNLKPGQKIVLESGSACGLCRFCKDAKQDLCENVTGFASAGYFGFGEELISPAVSILPYNGISSEEACLSEPLGVAIDMHRLCDVKLGDHVLVSGLGTIGLMAVRLAKLSGAEKIYAVNNSNSKIKFETAKKFGADEVISVEETPIEKYKFSKPVNKFMVTSPPKTIVPFINMAAPGAIISYIGIKYGDGATIAFDANVFHFKKLQLRGAHPSPGLFIPLALELIKTKMVDAKSLITHIFPLKDMKEALRIAAYERDKTIKVVVKP